MDPTPSSSAVLNPAKKRKTRQKYSCAECRRLKIKCSRTWPCDACVKGGCEKICPDGQLRKSQGRRIFVNDPEDTSYALFEAGSNVQYPEQGDHRNDPDRQVQSTSYPSHPARPLPSLGRPSSSSNPHPANGYKHGPKLPIYKGQTVPGVRPTSSLRHTAGSSSTRPNDAEEQLVGSTLGTLRSGKENVSRYVGKLAGSEYLQDLGRDGEEGLMSMSASPMPTRGPATIEHQRSSNIGTKRPLDGIEDIRAKLPDWETEGRALVDTYWNNVDWIQQAIPRPVFDGDFLLNAYDTTIPPNLHKIAVVFLVMALGVMFDLSGEPYRQRGADLFALGRACVEHEDGGQASLATVQAALLSGTYILNDNNSSGAETFWPIIGSAIKTAQSIGLHRDGTLFDLSDYEVQYRRQVWWELITYDRLQALCFGRPCSTRNQQTDTEFPEAEDSFLQDRVHYHGSKHRLIHKTERVIDLQNQITPLSYSSILDADAELEEFRKSLPVELLGQLEIEDLPLRPTIHPHTVLQRFGIRLLVAQTRLYLNKPAFSRALSVDPVAPDQSSFGGSFFALYHSAQEIIHLVKQLVLYRPSLIARLWAFWFHAFSASVCLAAIVIQAPRCRFAGEALTGLSIICDISAAAREGCRAKKGLHTLLRLRRRAQESLELVTSPQIGVSNLDTNAAPGVSGQTPGFADSTTPYRNPFDLTHSPADETVVHTPAKTLVLEKQPVVSIDPEPVPMFMGDPAGGGWNDPIPPAVAGVNIDLSLGFNFEEFLNEIREDNFSFMP